MTEWNEEERTAATQIEQYDPPNWKRRIMHRVKHPGRFRREELLFIFEKSPTPSSARQQHGEVCQDDKTINAAITNPLTKQCNAHAKSRA